MSRTAAKGLPQLLASRFPSRWIWWHLCSACTPDPILPLCSHPFFALPSGPAPPPPPLSSLLPREQRSCLLMLTPSSSFQPLSRLPGAVQGPGCRLREHPSVERPLGSGVSPVFLVNILHVFSKFLFCFLFGHFPTPKGQTKNFEKPHSIFRKKGLTGPAWGPARGGARGPWQCCMQGWGCRDLGCPVPHTGGLSSSQPLPEGFGRTRTRSMDGRVGHRCVGAARPPLGMEGQSLTPPFPPQASSS